MPWNLIVTSKNPCLPKEIFYVHVWKRPLRTYHRPNHTTSSGTIIRMLFWIRIQRIFVRRQAVMLLKASLILNSFASKSCLTLACDALLLRNKWRFINNSNNSDISRLILVLTYIHQHFLKWLYIWQKIGILKIRFFLSKQIICNMCCNDIFRICSMVLDCYDLILFYFKVSSNP